MGRMARSKAVENPGSRFSEVLDAAARLPFVRIDRGNYLRTELKRYCTEEQIDRAVAGSPAAAGIPFKFVTDVANASVAFETGKVTAISAVAGIPGGFTMIGAVPTDLAQYVGHILRIAQELAYIYSWPDLFGDESEELDEATENILMLFVGVMFGIKIAQSGVAKVATLTAASVAKRLPQKALTKGIVYPIVKKVAGYLGVSMTKKVFASGVAKAIPLAGAVLSGGPNSRSLPSDVEEAAKPSGKFGTHEARASPRWCGGRQGNRGNCRFERGGDRGARTVIR